MYLQHFLANGLVVCQELKVAAADAKTVDIIQA
jgi:hypothetical protein